VDIDSYYLNRLPAVIFDTPALQFKKVRGLYVVPQGGCGRVPMWGRLVACAAVAYRRISM
jgi:hypothetical protein